MIYQICIYFLLFIIYSCMGWIIEVIGKLIEKHRFINRGFLIGPYCPIYGWGCLTMILLLNKYLDEPVILFFMAILICSFLEYFTSYFMEKLFNARWWDYSKRKFNINGRICLETMIPFGILGCLILYIVNPFIINILDKVPSNLLYVLALFLFIIYVIDNIISLNIMVKFKTTMKTVERDGTEEITKKVKAILFNRSWLYRRLIKAFPNLKNHKELLMDIQTRVNNELKKINTKINKTLEKGKNIVNEKFK